ncbi:MAG: hypothetical protein ACKVVP_20040 [Chloroflexota bacterium]
MHYELWDTASANLIGYRDSEDEILEVVFHYVQQEGQTAVDWLAVVADFNADELGNDAECPAALHGSDLFNRLDQWRARRTRDAEIRVPSAPAKRGTT